jgi:hypothetical protein
MLLVYLIGLVINIAIFGNVVFTTIRDEIFSRFSGNSAIDSFLRFLIFNCGLLLIAVWPITLGIVVMEFIKLTKESVNDDEHDERNVYQDSYTRLNGNDQADERCIEK